MLLRIFFVAHSQGDRQHGANMLLRWILLPCLSAGAGSCSVLATMELVAVSWLMRGASGWHVLAPDATAGAAILPCTLMAGTCNIP